jgi:DNA-binding CsgD family transcriptional regulator
VLSIIGAASPVMNLVDPEATHGLLTGLRLLNYTCATAFIAVLPLLIHSIYRTSSSKTLNLGFLGLSIVTAATGVVLAATGLPETGGLVILGIKDLVILYAILRICTYRHRRHDGEIQNVLHFIMIGSALVFPIIVASELAPNAFRSIVPIEFRGSVSLPLAYLLWSVAYLLSWFRGYIRPAAPTDEAYDVFAGQFGLSPRETEVMRLLLAGESYKEIMGSLFISMPTVKSHISSIYRKTKCNNKMQLSLLFSSAGSTKG